MRPLVEVRLADLERLAAESPRSAGLTPDVVHLGRRAGGVVRARAARPPARSASTSASSSSGSTSTPASAGTNSGGPPTRVATTDRPDASASSADWPNGSTSDGWQTTSARGDLAGDPVVRDRAGELDAWPSLELAAQWPDADERQRSLAEPLERAREAHDVLPLRQRADADEPRPGAVGARASARKRSRSTPQSTTSVLPRASGTAASSRVAQPAETAITVCARRTTSRVASRTTGELGGVRDVLAVRGDDERRARQQRGREAGRDEKVRVDDVRPEPARRPPDRGGEPKMPPLPAAAVVEHGALDLVAERGELPLEPLRRRRRSRAPRPRGTSARRAGCARP